MVKLKDMRQVSVESFSTYNVQQHSALYSFYRKSPPESSLFREVILAWQ